MMSMYVCMCIAGSAAWEKEFEDFKECPYICIHVYIYMYTYILLCINISSLQAVWEKNLRISKSTPIYVYMCT